MGGQGAVVSRELDPVPVEQGGEVAGGRRGPVGDAGVEGLSTLDGLGERGRCLLQWDLGVVAVSVEDIDVVDVEVSQCVIETGTQVFA
jgi:hypothetical protein